MPTLALIGAAHIHTPDFSKRLNKRDAARAEAAATKLGAQVAVDLDDVYADSEVEAVVVCTETNRLVMPAVKVRKHLFVEKPLGFVGEVAYRNAVMEALYKGAQTTSWVTPRAAL